MPGANRGYCASLGSAAWTLEALPIHRSPACRSSLAARDARPPRPEEAIDAEALVRGFVANLQTQGNSETERLRDAMRRAIAVLQAAVG